MTRCSGLTVHWWCAASCNLAYTAAMQWEDRQCQLAKTVFGNDEAYTLGGDNLKLQAQDLLSHAVSACPIPFFLT